MILEFEILNRAASINLDVVLDSVFKKEVVQNFVETLNKEQLESSIDREGEQLSYVDAKGNKRTGYSPLTAKLSGGKKKIGQPFNLFDTGDFYKSISADLETNGIKLTANPIKEDANLFEKFGEEIIGLTEENLQRFIDFIRPIFVQEVRKILL